MPGEAFWVWSGLGAFILLLYGQVLSGWWAFDDPQILKVSYNNDFWTYFIFPEVWKAFQPANLNPWILFSFDVDLALFGLNPKWFYAHQLIILWLVGGFTYQLLRPVVNCFWAAAAPVLFVCSAPVTNSLYQLMTRHYLEGLLFSIFAIHCYLMALRKYRFLWVCLGGLCYFFAASAKEVYVVLPLMLCLIPLRSWRNRLVCGLPFFIMLGVYILWRRYMLGNWVGGYGKGIDWTGLCDGVFGIPSTIFGDSLLGLFAFGISVLIILLAVWRNRALWLCFVGLIILILGPIVPAISISDPQRLLLFFVWALSVAMVLCLGNITFPAGRFKPLCILLVAVIGVSLASRAVALRPGLESACHGYEIHGRFVMEQNEEQVLLPFAAYGNWFTAGLVWLRVHMLKGQPPKVVYDEIDLAELEGTVQNVFCFDPAANKLRKVPGGVEEIRSNWSGKLRRQPISVHMDYEKGVVSWDFGPHVSGQYSIITYGESGSKMTLPSRGFRRKDMSTPIIFRVRYDAPDGWIAYSEMLQFDGRALITIENPRRTGL